MDADRTISVLVADDKKATLEAIAGFLETKRFQVIGRVASGAELVRQAKKLAPDIAVTDISMPGLSGVDAISELRKMGCNTKVVILTVHTEQEFVQAAFSAGASSYVLKPRLVSDLACAIELALQGERFISPPLEDPSV